MSGGAEVIIGPCDRLLSVAEVRIMSHSAPESHPNFQSANLEVSACGVGAEAESGYFGTEGGFILCVEGKI
jgi:hypothetical protein